MTLRELLNLPSRDERPIAGKTKPNKDEDAYVAWALRSRWCYACGARPSGRPPDTLETHHIVKQGRSHDPCNLIRLCRRCHDLAENLDVRDPATRLLYPKLTIGICLTLKMVREPDEYDSDRLRVLRGSALPDPLPVPAFVEREFRSRRRDSRHMWCPDALVAPS